jgi:hypothetical protein
MYRTFPCPPSKFGCRISEKIKIINLKLCQHIGMVELMYVHIEDFLDTIKNQVTMTKHFVFFEDSCMILLQSAKNIKCQTLTT